MNDDLKAKIKTRITDLETEEESETLEMIETKEDQPVLSFFKNPHDRGKLMLTDQSYAAYFIDLYKDKIRYNATDRKWYIWTGKVWTADEIIFSDLLKAANDNLLQIAKTLENKSRRKDFTEKDFKNFVSYIERYQNNRKITGMLELAKTYVEVYTKEEYYNSYPNLFNCESGTIELNETGFNQRKHRPEDHLTQIVNGVEYRPGADCPYFKNILNTIFNQDRELISFIQRALGYTLTGHTNEQCLFFMYGTGRNGKSTFIEIIKYIFGHAYYKKINTESIMLQDKGKTANNDIAGLKGSRLVIGSETERGRRLAESLVKDLTGGDEISARFLFQEFFSYKPQFKIWLYGNHKPEIRGTDEGIRRRIKLIPFTVAIDKDKIVSQETIMHEIKKELPGIFNWILQGYVEYKTIGLNEPDAVRKATAEYFNEQDILIDFINICDTETKNSAIELKKLYDHYKDFCGQDVIIKHTRTFSKLLRERGFRVESNTKDNNKIYAFGIIPKNDGLFSN